MFDIITFGSATRDAFFISKKFLLARHKKFTTGRGLCLSLGSKIEIEDVLFRTGGGGTNTVTTFANQGFKTAFCGTIGKDISGQMIINELKASKIYDGFVRQTNLKPTSYSVILTSPGKDRTILAYRGASTELAKKDISWKRLKAKWLYLAPLSGKLCGLFEHLVDFAYKNKMKVVVNPGKSQLSLEKKTLKRILKKIDILILNQEEASLLTNIPYQKEREIFQKLDELVSGIAIMTKGPEGVIVSDGKFLYQAKPVRSKVVERTGAGDSFGSGFVSSFMKEKDIEKAIQFGVANASSCLKEWGAKDGLLKKGQKWTKVKIRKELCSAETNICQIK